MRSNPKQDVPGIAVVGATVTVTEWSDLRYFGLAPGTARLLISKIRAVNLFDL